MLLATRVKGIGTTMEALLDGRGGGYHYHHPFCDGTSENLSVAGSLVDWVKVFDWLTLRLNESICGSSIGVSVFSTKKFFDNHSRLPVVATSSVLGGQYACTSRMYIPYPG